VLEAWTEVMAQAATIKKGPTSEADHVGICRARMDFSAIKKERLIMVEKITTLGQSKP
jgi:hypothetical protein